MGLVHGCLPGMLPSVRSAFWITLVALFAFGCAKPSEEATAGGEGSPQQPVEAPTPTPSGTWDGTVGEQPLAVTIDAEGNLTWLQGEEEKKGRARFEGDSVYFLFDSGGGLLLEQSGAELTGELKETEDSEPQIVTLSRQEAE